MVWQDRDAWFGRLVVHGLESWWFMAWKVGGSWLGKMTWLEKITGGPWLGKGSQYIRRD